jgi:hypothetical protein
MSGAFDEAFDFGAFDVGGSGATLVSADAGVTAVTLTDGPVTIVTRAETLVTVGVASDVLLTGV